ncbi:MAG: type IV pilus modification PilV family protein [Syntrophomonadaceae bacterium]|jgi:Tfp pilus assembly protein PilV
MEKSFNFYKQEEGLSLIEVMAALVLLSLSAITLLSVFTNTSQWIKSSGNRTIIMQYANAILESTRAQASDLTNLQFPFSGVLKLSDSNELDNEFNYRLTHADEVVFAINIYAPATDLIADATLCIARHDEVSYYPDDNISLPFDGNLFDVKVEIEWKDQEVTKSYEISTIVGSK